MIEVIEWERSRSLYRPLITPPPPRANPTYSAINYFANYHMLCYYDKISSSYSILPAYHLSW